MSVILFKRKSLLDKMLSAVKAVGGAAWYVPDDFLVLGPELVTDPNFQNPSNWAFTQPTSGSVSVSGGALRINSTDGSYAEARMVNPPTIVPGKQYYYEFEIASATGIGARCDIGSVVGGAKTTVGLHIGAVTATAANYPALSRASASATDVTITRWSMREIISAKDFQYTSGETTAYLGGSVGLMYDAIAQLGADKNTLPYSGWSKPTGVTTDGDSLILADFSTSHSTYGMIGIEQGKSYRISYTISEYVSGNIKAICSTSVSGAVRSTNGTYTEILVPSSTGGNFGFQPATLNFTGKIRVNYVREVTGVMVSQATAANKPTITRIPRKLGPELVTNGDFSNGTAGWTASTNTAIANVSGELEITTNGVMAYPGAGQIIQTTIGKTYKVTLTSRRGTSTSSAGLAIVRSGGSGNLFSGTTNTTTTTGQFTTLVASDWAQWQVFPHVGGNPAVAGTVYFDDISVREVLEWSYALSFDGTNDSLAAPVSVIGANLSQPYTMIAWGRVGAIGASRMFQGDSARSLSISTSGQPLVTNHGTVGAAGVTTLTQGQLVVIEATWDGAFLKLYLNGIQDASVASAAPTSAATVTNIGQLGNSSGYYNAEIGGCVVAPAVMTEAQRKAVRNFAAFDLGLTLP